MRCLKTANGKHRLELSCLDYVMTDGHIRTDAHCEFNLKKGAHGEANGLKWWSWDGNEVSPTISPSIDCQSCGLHVTVTNGQESGRPQAYTMKNYSRDGNVYDEHGRFIY